MTKEEIKKALYREKPTAKLYDKNNLHFFYSCQLENGGTVFFKVPVIEMGNLPYSDEEQGQLLIRYIQI